MGSGRGLRGDESRFLGAGVGTGGPGDSSRCRHDLTLAAAGGRNPSALDVGSAIEASTFATSSAPAMAAIFLGLVSTVLARHCGAR